MTTIDAAQEDQTAGGSDGNGPTYFLSIEDQPFEWHEPTITAEQIANLGGWDKGESRTRPARRRQFELC